MPRRDMASMMMIVELHPEVIKFLEETGTIFVYGNNERGYQVNRTIYRETDEEGIYTVSFIDLSYEEE
jgi:hypothetical protein